MDPFNPVGIGCLTNTFCAYGDLYQQSPQAQQRRAEQQQQQQAIVQQPQPEPRETVLEPVQVAFAIIVILGMLAIFGFIAKVIWETTR